MWELDSEESWVPKNDAFELWCWRRLLRIPWTARRCNQSILKEISPGCSLVGLIWKDPDAGKDRGQEEKGMTEDEMVAWHHWLNGHGFGWTPRVGDGQGGLACCDSWGRKESDMTEWLNWTEDWNIVGLQYCVNFYCTAKCFSYTHTHTHTHTHTYTCFKIFFSIMIYLMILSAGTSLLVQRMRICLPMKGTRV